MSFSILVWMKWKNTKNDQEAHPLLIHLQTFQLLCCKVRNNHWICTLRKYFWYTSARSHNEHKCHWNLFWLKFYLLRICCNDHLFLTHPLSSTSCTVLLVSLKLKHLLTFIPILPENKKWPFVQRLFLPKEKKIIIQGVLIDRICCTIRLWEMRL